MSNARRPGGGNTYRSGYLKSRAWHTRRDRWFTEQLAATGRITCAVTGQPGSKRTLQLHHVDYSGVDHGPAGWIANEAHGDLIALRPDVHEALHRLLDTDQVLKKNLSRRAANTAAIRKLRARVQSVLTDWMQQAGAHA